MAATSKKTCDLLSGGDVPRAALSGRPGPDNKSFGCCCRNSRPSVINPLNILELRYKGRNGVSHHQPHDCLLDRRRWKKICKLRVTDLCVGNSPVTGKFPTQTASNAENVSTWWRHHERRQAASLCQLCASSVVWVTSYKTSAEILQNLTQSQVKTIKTASVYLKKHLVKLNELPANAKDIDCPYEFKYYTDNWAGSGFYVLRLLCKVILDFPKWVLVRYTCHMGWQVKNLLKNIFTIILAIVDLLCVLCEIYMIIYSNCILCIHA